MADEASKPLYEWKVVSQSFRVWPNRVEMEHDRSLRIFGKRLSTDVKSESILLRNIVSVEAEVKMTSLPKLVIKTNDGKQHSYMIPEALKVRDIILNAM